MKGIFDQGLFQGVGVQTQLGADSADLYRIAPVRCQGTAQEHLPAGLEHPGAFPHRGRHVFDVIEGIIRPDPVTAMIRHLEGIHAAEQIANPIIVRLSPGLNQIALEGVDADHSTAENLTEFAGMIPFAAADVEQF